MSIIKISIASICKIRIGLRSNLFNNNSIKNKMANHQEVIWHGVEWETDYIYLEGRIL